MIIRTQYECEVCHERYDHKESAKQCEEKPIPSKPNFVVGEMIKVKTRYDGVQSFKITEILLMNHEWVVRVDQEVQLGKQYWSNLIPKIYWEN
jgi:hypothetical protein